MSSQEIQDFIFAISAAASGHCFVARQTGLETVADRQPDGSPDPLKRLQLDENEKRFMTAVRELPDTYRAVFILRTFDELSYDEIAERLEISVGTVDSRLFRARRLLMEKLKDLLE